MKITKIRHTKIKNIVESSRKYFGMVDVFEPPKNFITINIVPKKEDIGDELFISLINFADVCMHIGFAKTNHLYSSKSPNVFNFDTQWSELFDNWASHVLYWNDKAFNDGFPESVGSKLLWAWKKDKQIVEVSPKTKLVFFPESQ